MTGLVSAGCSDGKGIGGWGDSPQSCRPRRDVGDDRLLAAPCLPDHQQCWSCRCCHAVSV